MNESFVALYRGHLQGIMSEEAYSSMAKSLQNGSVENGKNKTWFAIDWPVCSQKAAAGGSPDAGVISAKEVGIKLMELYEEVKIRKSISGKFPHTYVKDRENPGFIKLYDPQKCGGSCSTIAPDPWWVFSTVAPAPDELLKILVKK